MENKDEGGASTSPVHSANKWESASFGDDAQREKFLRLMGGMKKQHTGRFVIGETNVETHTRTDDENKEIAKTMEHQYQTGMEKKLTGQNRRHVGLGFSEPEEEEEKKEEKDLPQGTHTRFDDDGNESGSRGKSGDDGGSETRSRVSQEKDRQHSEDRDRDRDKERRRDESHRSSHHNRGEKREHRRTHHRSGDDRKQGDHKDSKDSHKNREDHEKKREDHEKKRDEEAKTAKRDDDRKHRRDDRELEDTSDHHRKKQKSLSGNSD